MLSVSLRRIPDREFLFCDAEGCSVVYFTREGDYAFWMHEIREQVYQKAPEDQDSLVCYCFQHSVGDLRSAAAEGRAAMAEDITSGTRTGQCACELRNPQGSLLPRQRSGPDS